MKMLLVVVTAMLAIGQQSQQTTPNPSSLPPLTEAAVRKVAAEAGRAANNDPELFKELFRTDINVLLGVERQFTMPIYTGPVFVAEAPRGLLVTVAGPVGKFETVFAEELRQFKPTNAIPWSKNITVTICPGEIGVPQVQKIIVQRNGTIVPQLLYALKPVTLTSKLGVKEVNVAGDVTYAPSPLGASACCVYALASALAAAATPILAKIGVEHVPSNLARAIRTAVVLVFAWGIVVVSLALTMVLAVAVLGESISWKVALGGAPMVAGALLTLAG